MVANRARLLNSRNSERALMRIERGYTKLKHSNGGCFYRRFLFSRRSIIRPETARGWLPSRTWGMAIPILLSAIDSDDTVSVLLGNGDGTFAVKTYATGNFPAAIIVADLGNGHPDILVANTGDEDVCVLFGNGNGTFRTQVTVPLGVEPMLSPWRIWEMDIQTLSRRMTTVKKPCYLATATNLRTTDQSFCQFLRCLAERQFPWPTSATGIPIPGRQRKREFPRQLWLGGHADRQRNRKH